MNRTTATGSTAASSPRAGARARLAADIGGTFTDVVLETPTALFTCKVLTTPREPHQAVMEGVARLLTQSGVQPADVGLFIHGTTLATNALIERKGAPTALITTEGFRDVLGMGFEKRFDAYDINIERPPELVPRTLRFGVRERMGADGSVLLPMDEADIVRIAHELRTAKIRSVAIGFIHAWAYPAHEQRAREILSQILGESVSICLSSEVCPEMREYERFSTTVANAYVRPLMAGYLHRLNDAIKAAGMSCPLLLMMSGGGLTTLEQASRFPIRLVESGPAGGAILAAHLARECSLTQVLAFDMGGTTAKICLISDGEPERSRRFEVGRAYRNLKGSGLPIRIPVIELVEIGAGGGSIGRVDGLARITVGPDSCGAEPGPACYARGGREPAVTDANLVLGRLDPERFAAGRLRLDTDRAAQALLEHVGNPLGMDAYWAAAGISEIVEENMANAARVHAIERGKSLEHCTMIAFGGGAPLHAGRLAQKLGIRRVLIPAGAGVGSAIGFLRAPISYEVVRSDHSVLTRCDPAQISFRLAQMREEALAVVGQAALGQTLVERRMAELRYVGQGHELRLRLPGSDGGPVDHDTLRVLMADFEVAYERIYGLRIAGSPIEVITWSVTLSTPPLDVPSADWPSLTGDATAQTSRPIWEPRQGAPRPFDVHWRFDLSTGQRVRGPALVGEDETTSVVPEGWIAFLDTRGHLILETAA